MRKLAIAALLIMTSSACATALRAEAPEQSEAQRPRPNYENPNQGESVSSLEEARQRAGFQARESGWPESPKGIFVKAAETVEGASVAMTFDKESHGRVVLIQIADSTPEALWLVRMKQLVSEHGTSEGAEGSLSIVSIKGGKVSALLMESAEGLAGVRWREPGRRLQISGPNLTREAVLELAESA